MFEEKHPSLICSAFPPSSISHSLHLIYFPLSHSFVLSTLCFSLYAGVLSRPSSSPPLPLSSSSQLVPCAPVLQFRLQHVRVLGLKAQLPLLLSLP